jgi:antitoxin (DNA-binding transcriptional repressor) of toxin-antitoxin stability system
MGGRLDDVATGGYIASMKEIGIRELKNRLSEYIRLVREGEVVVVTDRGKVVAELRPPGGPDLELARKYPKLVEMARQGLVRLGKPNHPGLYVRLPAVTPPGTAQQLLDETREDR